MIGSYDWADGREAMLRFGPADGPVVLVAMPLLEEWNRTRAFTVALLRALALRGIASILPDLPGHGESLEPATALSLDRIAAAFGALAEGRRAFGIGIRSGALVTAHAGLRGRWHLSPVSGPDLLADLHRTWLAAGQRGDRSVESMVAGQDGATTIAGRSLPTAFLKALQTAEAAEPDRVVRLASDPRPADRHVEAAPLWRRSEPTDDRRLAELLADDIYAWTMTCGG